MAFIRGTALLAQVLTGVLFGAAPAAGADKSAKEYRDFALRNEGNPEKGRTLFQDARTACFQCHSTDGTGGKTGPDLYAAGDKFSRLDLIRAVLEPSANIFVGYATTVVETRAGERVEGVFKGMTDTELLLAGAGSVTQKVARAEVKRQTTSAVSLMPEGLQAGLSLEEFADLVAYLEQLKQPEMQLANAAGTPLVIEALARPIMARAFHGEGNRFERPIWFEEHPVLAGAFVVAEQNSAKLWLLEKGEKGEKKTLFSDVRSEVFVTDTEGLLGVAFHPRFASNRKFYLMHEVMENGARAMAIAEREAKEGFRSDRGTPSRRVLTIDAPTEVHHGGGILFGPDGFLYIGMGDAGPQGDPRGHGQNLGLLAGKLLRIDVDRNEGGRNYGIPPSNPFAGADSGRARPEIFAYGLRQPWRFSFDSATGLLWVGDVGQDRFEEIALVRAGENHGWNVFEGFELYSTAHRREGEHYVFPVVSFRRKHGVSVTGGAVYRGRADSSFYGVYIGGDYESKKIWGVTLREGKLGTIREIGTCPGKIVSFGFDRAGEIYAVGYDSGMIYHLDFTAGKFE